MKNRILSASATFLVAMSFFLISVTNCFGQQGETGYLRMHPVKKNEIFSIEVVVDGGKTKIVQLVELFVKNPAGNPMSFLTYDEKIYSQAKTFDTDSTYLVFEAFEMDDARILETRMFFGNIFRESEEFLKDSIDYYNHKRKGLKKKERLAHQERITQKLIKLQKSNSRNFDYLKTQLELKRGSYIVHNFDKRNRFKLIKKVKKTSSG